jgi:hypothetical protein
MQEATGGEAAVGGGIRRGEVVGWYLPVFRYKVLWIKVLRQRYCKFNLLWLRNQFN